MLIAWRRRTVEWFVLGAVLALSTFAAVWMRPTEGHAGPLVAVETDLDFGDAWMQKSFPWGITLRNTSDRPVTIERLESSCSCASSSIRNLEIPAGATSRIPLTIDLTNNSAWESNRPFSPYSVRILPILRDNPQSRLSWVLQGTVHSVFGNLPTDWQWLDEDIFGTPYQSRPVHIATTPDVASIRVEIPGAVVSPPKAVANGFEIRVSPASDLPFGPYHCRGSAVAVLRSGVSLPRFPSESWG